MKTFVRVGLILLAVIGATVAAIEHHAVAAARAEHQVLLGETEEARRLAEQNKDIARLRNENEKLAKLREENKELPRLRNEIRKLRRQAEELATLRTENARLQSQQVSSLDNPEPVPPDFIERIALVDSGLGSPEATAQTYFWAMCQGNLEQMADCTVDGRQGLNTDLEWQRQQLAKQMKNFPGFRIAGRQDISPDEVELRLQSKMGGTTMPMKFRRMDDRWKVEQ